MSFVSLIEWLHYECSSAEVFFYLLITFLLFVLLSSIIAYLVLCAVNKNTEMSGIIRMKLTLNDTPKGKSCGSERLEYDEFLIAMKDMDGAEHILKPQLNWMQKMFSRRYSVSTLLYRYCDAMNVAGSGDDPARLLILELLKDDAFCRDMGLISFRGSRSGLRTAESLITERNLTSTNTVSIYRMIPEIPAGEFRQYTGCTAEMLCVRMEYWDI